MNMGTSKREVSYKNARTGQFDLEKKQDYVTFVIKSPCMVPKP